MDIGREPIRQPGDDSEREEQADSIKEGARDSLARLSQVADKSRRELIGSDTDAKSGGDGRSLSSRRAKVEEVRQRLAQGYYGTPEIRNKIADKLADNINP